MVLYRAARIDVPFAGNMHSASIPASKQLPTTGMHHLSEHIQRSSDIGITYDMEASRYADTAASEENRLQLHSLMNTYHVHDIPSS
jgi:hypothetical protein